MEDKDLDTYFKDRSGSFNENPGEALWAKIEANIEPPASPKGNARTWLMGIGGVVLLGAIAVWFFVVNNNEKAAAPQQQQKEITVVKDTIQHAQDTVVANSTSINGTAPAEVYRASEKPVAGISQKQAVKDTIAVTKLITTPYTPIAKAAAPAGSGLLSTYKIDATDAAKSNIKNIPYGFELDKNKDEMVINVTQKLSRAERDKLVSSTLQLNAPYLGRKIVINAKGYRLYRHAITKQDSLKYAPLLIRDSIKTQKLKIEIVTDTLLYKVIRDTAYKGETIKFEKNVVPKQ